MAFTQSAQMYYSPMMDDRYFYGGYGFMLFLCFIAIVLLILFFVKYNDKNSQKEDPIEIVKKRYANGEITKEEFDKLKKDLK